jgi:lysophospholipase L1-like esterase
MSAPDQLHFSRGRSILFASILTLGFFTLAEVTLRIVGVARPVSPRILLHQMDSDITLPFIKADKDVFWSPQPGFKGEFQGKPVSINSIGLRGGEVPARRPGSRRVLCFGDSITFGYGAGDDETYPFHLGQLLGDGHVEVLNAGVTGFTSHQVLGHVRRLLPMLRPDVVTVCIGWNDGNVRTADDREYARRLALARDVDGALDQSYLYRALKATYLRSQVRAGTSATRDVARVSLEQYKENLAAIVAECRKAGARPVFISLPQRKDPSARRSRGTPYAVALIETARSLNVPVLDVGELGIDTTRSSTMEYFIDSLHFSPAGSERMAQILAPQLAAAGVLGP